MGNKCDLEDQRVVQKSDGERLAAQLNNCPFFETSAKDHVNVDECFRELVREVRRRKEGSGLAPTESKPETAAPSGKAKKSGCILL